MKDTRLPSGKTCNDCFYANECVGLHKIKLTATHCICYPIRFRDEGKWTAEEIEASKQRAKELNEAIHWTDPPASGKE